MVICGIRSTDTRMGMDLVRPLERSVGMCEIGETETAAGES